MNEKLASMKVRRAQLLRLKIIIYAHETFWMYCKTLAPDFYRDDRPHLKELCDTLQAFWERKLLKENGEPYLKLMINMPPRFGKTRTLFLFCAWIIGLIMTTKVIACSYNDLSASDFSRYTRDTIGQPKNLPHQITHRDIFPECRLKHGYKSFERWALEGQYFNYLGAGVGGSITGKGADVQLSDDLVKDAYEAYHKTGLEKKWLWYTGTFQSRGEQKDEYTESLEIMAGTRWAKADPSGRILDSDEAKDWYIFQVVAIKNGKMTCPSILSLKRYLRLKRTMDHAIFRANYHNEPIDILGKLYTQILTYTDLPKDENGNQLMERIASYTDVADQGDDYLVTFIFLQYHNEAWILDVQYTKEGMEITEPETAALLNKNEVNFAMFESNAGGRSFARAVRRCLVNNHKNTKTKISWFHQSKNKEARILSNSNYVMQHVYFPHNWKDRWPNVFDDIMGYQKEGDNKYDDAEDALTGVSEMIDTMNVATAGPRLRR